MAVGLLIQVEPGLSFVYNPRVFTAAPSQTKVIVDLAVTYMFCNESHYVSPVKPHVEIFSPLTIGFVHVMLRTAQMVRVCDDKQRSQQEITRAQWVSTEASSVFAMLMH